MVEQTTTGLNTRARFAVARDPDAPRSRRRLSRFIVGLCFGMMACSAGAVAQTAGAPAAEATDQSYARVLVWSVLIASMLGLAYFGWRAFQTSRPHMADPDGPVDATNGSDGASADRPPSAGISPLRAALTRYRSAIVATAIFSCLINVLMLTGAFFMLLVYDRVLPSQSVPTLYALALIALFLFVSQGILDAIRSRLLSRLSIAYDLDLGPRILSAVYRVPAHKVGGDGLQLMRDHDRIRGFIGSPGPVAFFDLPWMPIYLLVIFLLHPLLGWAACGGAIVLVLLTLASEYLSKAPLKDLSQTSQARYKIAEAVYRAADVVRSMGLGDRVRAIWEKANADHAHYNTVASDIAGGLSTTARTLRLILQSAVLGLGAYLVLQGEASAGVIIAGSILTSRALAPLDAAIAHWKAFVGARESWDRLRRVFLELRESATPQAKLAKPSKSLDVSELTVRDPISGDPIIFNISFRAEAGDAIAIIGESGCGKTTLAETIVGLGDLNYGAVKLDNAHLSQWSEIDRGAFIGYLPQNVQLMDGSIRDNICRFDPNPDDEAIFKAARLAGIDDLVRSLPGGYDRPATALSDGQAQRIGLGRALYKDPFLVILDEPYSNLDGFGEAALNRAIRALRQQGAISLIIAHRRTAVEACNLAVGMAKGRMLKFGPRDEVRELVAKYIQAERQAAAKPTEVGHKRNGQTGAGNSAARSAT
ncbi:MAG: type I secretion system permease/ATPase, partial [Pseudomonadota bacterium]